MLASKSFARSAAPFVCHRRLRAANVEVQELVTTKSARRQVPLIERLGGPEAVQAAVNVFYGKVLADDRVKHYFDSTDMAKQRAHQAAFMTYAFGGSNKYQGKDLAAAHRHLIPHLTEQHFNAIVDNFVTTLQELGIQQEDIDECVKIVASTKDAVLAE